MTVSEHLHHIPGTGHTPAKDCVSTLVDDSLAGLPTKKLVPPGHCQFGEDFVKVPLLGFHPVSPTSTIFRFGLPDSSKPLNLSTCACLLAKVTIDGEDIIRPYTPISTNELKGCFDLLIKHYSDGKMSHFLHTHVQPGEVKVAFAHKSDKNVKIQAPFNFRHIVMLVGGTGITPMIQALHALLGDEESKTKVTLLYGSKVQHDILARSLLDNWAAKYTDRLQVEHILSHEAEDSEWNGLRGHITRDLIEKHVSSNEDLMFFVCGPPPMYNALCGPRDEKDSITGILGEMGYSPTQVYKF